MSRISARFLPVVKAGHRAGVKLISQSSQNGHLIERFVPVTFCRWRVTSRGAAIAEGMSRRGLPSNGDG